MFARLQAGLLWVGALRRASQGRHRESLALIDRLLEKYPSRLSFAVFRLMLQTNLEENDLVIERVPDLLARIANEKPDDDRRRYMTAFMQVLDCVAHDTLFGPTETSLEKKTAIDWKSINLKRIPRWMKRAFPLRRHPNGRNSERRD